MMLFALQESRWLGQAVAHQAGTSLAPLEEREFDGGEFKLRPLVSVRGQAVYITQSLAGMDAVSPSERLLRLLLLCFGLRDAGATELIVLLPYMPFARKDRRTQPRDPVTARYVAQLLEAAGVSQVVALDVHNPAALDNALRIPLMHLSVQPMLAARLGPHLPPSGLVVVSPDVGGVKRVQLLRELLATRTSAPIDLAFIEKRRAGGRVSGGTVVGNVRDRQVLVLDDLCASGGTLVRAADALVDAGAAQVQVAVTHAPLPAGLRAVLAAPHVSRVLATDSTGPWIGALQDPRLEVLPVAALLAEAARRIAARQPLSPLLKDWPP